MVREKREGRTAERNLAERGDKEVTGGNRKER